MYFIYNKEKIYYEKYGKSKKNMLILPGWGNTRKTFNSLIKNLKDEYTIFIFDYPGFGNSHIPNESLNIYDYSKIIASFMKEKNINNPIVIGHSFGGRIIITMNGFYNINFKKIILISSAGIKPTKTKKQILKQIIYKFLKKIGNFFPRRLRNIYQNKLISIFGSVDYKTIPEALRNTFINVVNEDLTKYINKISSETLLIWGDKDIDTPISDGLLMKKLINNSNLTIIENATHFCYLEHSLKVINEIKKFIKKD